MKEFNPFDPDKAPLTNFLGHQVSKAVSAASVIVTCANTPGFKWKHAYELSLMQQEKHDFVRGNAAAAMAIMIAALASNSF